MLKTEIAESVKCEFCGRNLKQEKLSSITQKNFLPSNSFLSIKFEITSNDIIDFK